MIQSLEYKFYVSNTFVGFSVLSETLSFIIFLRNFNKTCLKVLKSTESSLKMGHLCSGFNQLTNWYHYLPQGLVNINTHLILRS